MVEQETTFQKVRNSVALFGLALSIGSVGILLNQQDKQVAAAPLPLDQQKNSEVDQIATTDSPEPETTQAQSAPIPTTIIDTKQLAYEVETTPKPTTEEKSEAVPQPVEFADDQDQLLEQVVDRLKAGESISSVAEQYRTQKSLEKVPPAIAPITEPEVSSPKSTEPPSKPAKTIPATFAPSFSTNAPKLVPQNISENSSPTPKLVPQNISENSSPTPKLVPQNISENSSPDQQIVSAKTKQPGQIVPISSRGNALARQISKQSKKYRSYRIVRGDTLEQISRRTGISQVKLVKLNRLKNPNLLIAGQTLRIPQTITHVAKAPAKTRKQIAVRPKPLHKAPVVATLPVVQTITPVLQPLAPERQLIDQSLLPKAAKLIPEQLQVPASPSKLIEQIQETPIAKLPEVAIAANQLKHEIKLEQPLPPQVSEQLSESATAVNPELRQPLATLPQPRQLPTLEQVQVERPPLDLVPAPAKEINLPAPSTPSIRLNRINQLLQRQAIKTAAANPAPRQVLQLDRLNNLVQSPQLPDLSATAYLPDIADPSRGTIANSNFIWPARGSLTSGFGWRWGRVHQGIDIAGPVGTPIVAAASGVVNFAGWNSGGYGYMVDIRHPDGTVTRYAHNSAVYVRAGQTVTQGQPIAAMGSTGFSTGPHLHFEIRPNGGRAVNPMIYLAKR